MDEGEIACQIISRSSSAVTVTFQALSRPTQRIIHTYKCGDELFNNNKKRVRQQ